MTGHSAMIDLARQMEAMLKGLQHWTLAGDDLVLLASSSPVAEERYSITAGMVRAAAKEARCVHIPRLLMILGDQPPAAPFFSPEQPPMVQFYSQVRQPHPAQMTMTCTGFRPLVTIDGICAKEVQGDAQTKAADPKAGG